MPTLDDTAGGAAANSYASVSFADSYLENRPDATDWNDPLTGAETKAACLIRATQRLEQYQWRGTATATTQALQWPRRGLYNRLGVALSSSAIPDLVKQACCELALVMLADSSWGGPDGLERFNRIQLSQQTAYDIRHGGRGGLPSSVTSLLSDFILSTQAKILRA